MTSRTTPAAIPRPVDLVVGIDIGQTCSGVAYSIGPDWNDPRTINRWPSPDGFEKANKVATRVGYSRATGELQNWGFESVFHDPKVDVRELFKLTLDPEYEDDRGYTPKQAKRWYADYLRSLRYEIERFFDASIPGWRDLHVEYSFSTPTTWRNPAMIATIEKLVVSAGFAGPNSSVRMGLTEAEAAAIEATTSNYKAGDTFLICDAGGGTTDVNVLRVKSVRSRIELEPLDCVEGVSVGSTLIDFNMAEHIVERLKRIEQHIQGDIHLVANEMLRGRFQTIKHSFPSPPADAFLLNIDGLPGLQTFPEADIQDSKMVIQRTVLEKIFREQTRRIFDLIDERLTDLQENFPEEHVSYLVLSGGFGSSPYLFAEAQRRYQMHEGWQSPNTIGMHILTIDEPQLAVVRGLVRDRTQELGSETRIGQNVFRRRRCRNSYGIVVRVPYSEELHRGLPTIRDPNDNRLWVQNIVDWLIVKGQEVSVDEGIRRSYRATLADDERCNIRHARIVMCNHAGDQLPQLATDRRCQEVVLVSYTLTKNDMKQKAKFFKMKLKRYWKAHFLFVVKVGPADLRFEILGRDGVLSTDHGSLQVEFVELADPDDPDGTGNRGLLLPGSLPEPT